MIFKIRKMYLIIFFIAANFICFATSFVPIQGSIPQSEKQNFLEITDDNWKQITKGEWLIGFFDNGSPDSKTLEKDWNVFSVKCEGMKISVGSIQASLNPGLQVRFLVTAFPTVFHIKDGAVHEFQNVNRNALIGIIKNAKWETTETVSAFRHPFSTQMSVLSYLYVQAVHLYDYENTFLQKCGLTPMASYIVFGLIFVVVGTILGLVCVCLAGILGRIICGQPTKESPPEKIKKSITPVVAQRTYNISKEDIGKSQEDSTQHLRKRK